MYRKVRLACAEGMSQRQAAQHFKISRDSVRKILAFSAPPVIRMAIVIVPTVIPSRHIAHRVKD